MTRYRARRSRTRRWIEKILLLAGVAALGVWAWSVAGQAVYQDWGNWAFDRQVRGEPATVGEYLRSRLKTAGAATAAGAAGVRSACRPAARRE